MNKQELMLYVLKEYSNLHYRVQVIQGTTGSLSPSCSVIYLEQEKAFKTIEEMDENSEESRQVALASIRFTIAELKMYLSEREEIVREHFGGRIKNGSN